MEDRRGFREHDRYCVETNLAPLDSGTRGKSARRPDDILLFFVADRAIRTSKLCRCARLDFDEYEYPTISRDDVNLRITAVGAIIARKNA
jgi:hypothetical protein